MSNVPVELGTAWLDRTDIMYTLEAALKQYNEAAWDDVLSEWEETITPDLIPILAEQITRHGIGTGKGLRGDPARRISQLATKIISAS